MNVKELLTQSDNQTLCAIRAMGFMGVGLVAVAIVIGAPAIEAGAAIAAQMIPVVIVAKTGV